METVSNLSKEQVRQLIEKNRLRHQTNKVLHAHPSPLYWRPPDREINLDKIKKASIGRSTNMYMGIPFCIPTNPPHCGFCLFPTETYKGNGIDTYLEHLEKETEIVREFYEGTDIEALYVGGGTPNLLNPKDYSRLMKMAYKLFPKMENGIEKTLEGIPQLFNEDKVRAIRDAGFNRVSMGVQQMTERLIKYSGRKQTRKQIFDAIDLFDKYGLACNLDLIFGWPEQTVEDMLNDLRDAVGSGIRHITHYELNVSGRSDFSTSRRGILPDLKIKLEMFKAARIFLYDQGFVQRTVYDWEKIESSGKFAFERAGNYEYENNLREFIDVRNDGSLFVRCMGGIGYAAINLHVIDPKVSDPAVITMNHKSLPKYYEDVANGRLPIERAFFHKGPDIKLIWIFQALQTMKINKKLYNKIFGSSLYEEFKNIWDVLEEMGWIKSERGEILFVGEGEFYIPLIQTLFNKTRLSEISTYLSRSSSNAN